MSAAVSVLTRSYDNARSGANLQETVLTQASVRSKGVRELARLYLDGDQRGSEGQPLVVAGLTMADGLVHDVVFLATMSNDVYAYDLDTYELLWAKRVANPIVNTKAMDMYLINDHWGITGTPVIDEEAGIIYAVSMSSQDGTFTNTTHHLHALSLADGTETSLPVNLSLATYQPPGGLPLQSMNFVPRKQRCALALDVRNGVRTVFVANGSFNEDENNQGWLIAVDVTDTPTLACAITTSARYDGGGIWMGSQGPSIDAATGDVGLVVGNGAFDGESDWGESVIRYRYTPKAATAPASFAIVSWFTPYTDTGRLYGKNYQTLADTSLMPQAGSPGDDGSAPATSNMDGAGDSDLNSGGKLEITTAMSGFDKNLVVVCGKDGIGYVLDHDNLGNPTLADFAPDLIQTKVYDLALWIGWLTYYNPDASATPTDLSLIPTTYANRTHHLHGTCVFYKSAIHGPMIFCWGENGNLRAFAVNPDGTLVYLACSAEMASPQAPVPSGGMPGGMITLCAHGETAGTALILACVPDGDANKTITRGRFLIYDPETFGEFADGSGHIMPLWDSWNTGIVYSHCKFAQATVSGGKILVPTYDGCVLVLG